MTKSASSNPLATSPIAHSAWASPSGRRAPPAAANASAVHFCSLTTFLGGLPGSDGVSRTITLPSRRALGPPGRRLSSGSSANGSGSRSTLIFSIASAAIHSLSAATARIACPSKSGSLVTQVSSSGSCSGRSSSVRIACTPGIASAADASILRTRQCGIGDSMHFANSMPSARQSSA